VIAAEDIRPATRLGAELLPPTPPRHRSKGARADWYPVARPSPEPTDARRGR
jgi:hypothetical protein